MPTESAGERIRAWRRGRGMSQHALATWLGIHQSVVGLWEKDDRRVSRRYAGRLADLMEVNEEELLPKRDIVPVKIVLAFPGELGLAHRTCRITESSLTTVLGLGRIDMTKFTNQENRDADRTCDICGADLAGARA